MEATEVSPAYSLAEDSDLPGCSGYNDEIYDPYYGISFDMPLFEDNNIGTIQLPWSFCSTQDEHPPEDGQVENSTVLGDEARNASDSHIGATTQTFSSCTTSSSVDNVAAVAQGCELLTSSEPISKGNHSIIRLPQNQSRVSQVLPSTIISPPPYPSPIVASMSSSVTLGKTTPTLTHWQSIMPKPVSGSNLYRTEPSPLSKRKRPASPLEHFTRVDDCLIGVFSSGLPPKQKKRRAPKACLRCQFDHKECSGGRPCTRCLGIIGNIQSNRTVYWKYCVDSDILDGNRLQNSKLLHSIHIQTNFAYSATRVRILLVPLVGGSRTDILPRYFKCSLVADNTRRTTLETSTRF
ncbi:hypothetical protein F5Y12DRAFT_32147 [Xylaria sp. FL1777]|nr:hypothetical protein F5Y12DRAFT_32147 [Xylaria sp. FL1777]